METNKVNIADGKTLVIKYLGLGDVNRRGYAHRQLWSSMASGGMQVPDEGGSENIVRVPHGGPGGQEPGGRLHPGAVSKISVKVGDTVEVNQTLATIEAMKMETAIPARMSGVIERIEVSEGDSVKGGQL